MFNEQPINPADSSPDLGRLTRVAMGGFLIFVAVMLALWLVWQISTVLYEPTSLPLIDTFETENPLDNAFFMPEGYVIIVPPNAFRLVAYLIVASLLGIVARLTVGIMQAGLNAMQDKTPPNQRPPYGK